MKVRLMLVREGPRRKVTIESPEDVFRFLFKKAKGLDRECVWRIDLNARNKILGYEIVSVGTATASLIHPREVYKGAILQNACAIVIAHNHPSQDTSPSIEDKALTKRIRLAGELLGIPLHDHLILTEDSYFSFREGGLI